MGRVSLKTAICAVFCVWCAQGFGSCVVEPIDLTSFVENKDVQAIIDEGAGTVYLYDSEPGLKAGNSVIRGLEPGKYYTVEEWDKDGAFVGVQFVCANGTRSATLSDIGMASGGEITGLDNGSRYRVKAAVPLLGNVSYTVLMPPGPSGSATITDGLITLPGPADDSYIIYALSPPSPSFDIVEIPISPTPGSAKPATISGNNIIVTIGQETVNDYVYFEYIPGAIQFNVLRVASDQATTPPIPGDPEDLIINVTLSLTGDNSPGVTSTDYSWNQSDIGSVTFTIASAAQYTGITWYIDGTEVDTGSSFALDRDQIQYQIVGTYTITVVALRNGIPYSTAIAVTVSP